MSDSTGADADAADESAPTEDDVWTRDTAPQTPFTLRQVWIGLVIAAIGAVIAFGIPLALA